MGDDEEELPNVPLLTLTSCGLLVSCHVSGDENTPSSSSPPSALSRMKVLHLRISNNATNSLPPPGTECLPPGRYLPLVDEVLDMLRRRAKAFVHSLQSYTHFDAQQRVAGRIV